MDPRISIVIPVYNTEKFLKKCLDSVIQQSYKNIEIVIVNDASPDNSEAIILEYQQKDPRIKYIKHEVNKGLFTARETGVKSASGAYVLHVDSDDWIALKLCQKLIDSLSSNTDLVLFDTISVRSKGVEKSLWANKGNQNYKGKELFEALYTRTLLSWAMWGKLFSRELSLKIYQQIQMDQHLTMAEDLLFFCYYSYHVNETLYVPYNGYYYNLTNQSVNRTEYTLAKAQSHCVNLEIVVKGLEQFIHENNLNNDTFDKIKLELVQGYLVQIKDLSDEDRLVVQASLISLFTTQMLELSIDYSVMQQNIFRRIADKVISKIFIPNTWFYENLRRLLLKFIQK